MKVLAIFFLVLIQAMNAWGQAEAEEHIIDKKNEGMFRLN
jgi:hypothetical protein